MGVLFSLEKISIFFLEIADKIRVAGPMEWTPIATVGPVLLFLSSTCVFFSFVVYLASGVALSFQQSAGCL